MTYNFQDEENPQLTTTVDTTGTAVLLEEGSPQGDLLSVEFSGESVQVSILPPDGWTLDEVVWDSGTGTFAVPPAGEEQTHNFTYKVSQAGSGTLESGGSFKIKKLSVPD